ncbi:DUF1565 domain-containing protein [Candidatus Neomarinimicrobiota bacterium]
MKRYIQLCFLITGLSLNLQAIVINIPADHATIQAGIDAAADGDTVLVQPDRYVENINFNGKNIVVGSLFLTTDDTSYVSQTIIDGNWDDSCVLFESGEDSTARLSGFKVTNGRGEGGWTAARGGGISCRWSSNPTLDHLIVSGNRADYGGGIVIRNSGPILRNITIKDNQVSWSGGGIMLRNASPRLENITIIGNWASDAGGMHLAESSNPIIINTAIRNNEAQYAGGGMYCHDSSAPVLTNVEVTGNLSGRSGGGIFFYEANPIFSGVRITGNNTIEYGGGIYLNNTHIQFDVAHRSSIFLNEAQWGRDLFSADSTITDIVVDTFTVLIPTDHFALPADNFNFDILQGLQTQVDADLYVSPVGNDSNSGRTAEEPLQTISHALSIIAANSSHPHTIYLGNGTYSASTTGEQFPLVPLGYCTLSGESTNGVILDAEGTNRVFWMYYCRGNTIEHLTTTGGAILDFAWPNWGGGFLIEYSDTRLRQLRITGNQASGGGSGIYSNHSILDITDTFISNNACEHDGGGIYTRSSTLKLANVTISRNSAEEGGGIGNSGSSLVFDPVDRCNIYLNSSTLQGSDLYTSESDSIHVVVDTFTVLQPTRVQAYPLSSFTFDILHAKIEQVSADLYVNPAGSDANSGLSTGEPLRTISHALTRIIADSLNPRQVIMAEGTYSPSATGEVFPLDIPSYVTLEGVSETTTILDAEGQGSLRGGVIRFEWARGAGLKDIKITGGAGGWGGGIYCRGTDIMLQNLIVAENSGYEGGGICLEASNNITLDNIQILSNTSQESGGGIFCSESFAVMDRLVIGWNSTGYDRYGPGGGMNIEGSSPVISNSLIIYNTAATGGGLYCNGSPALVNVTVTKNVARRYGGGVRASGYVNPVVVNSILWDNSPDQIQLGNIYFDTVTVAFSNIEGGWQGSGNISENPLFVDTLNADFSLQAGSPCIDAGTPLFVLNSDTLVNLAPDEYIGDAPDIGAFEASFTSVYPGDTDNNGNVDALDILPIGIHFGQIGSPRISGGVMWNAYPSVIWLDPAATYADANGDGMVDEKDVIAIGVNWGNTHPPVQASYAVDPSDQLLLSKHRDAYSNLYQSLSGEGEATSSMRKLLRTILDLSVPRAFTLHQNYPNPFNPVTIIRFDLPVDQRVTLSIHNLLGQRVAILVDDQSYRAGEYNLEFDAINLSSGIYFYTLQTDQWIATRKMVILK